MRPDRPRLRPERLHHWPRVALGWLLCAEAASWVLAGVARLGPASLLHRLERAWANTTRRLVGIRLDLEGMHHLDPDERYLVVALHEGLVDPVMLLHLPLPLRFTVRDELFAWPALARYLRATSQPSVPTHASRAKLRALLQDIEEVLGGDESLVVFPQGSVLGLEVGFAPGAVRLARHAGRRLLPVVITGTHRVWEHPFSPTLRLDQPVSVRILAPRPPDTDLRRLEREMKAVATETGMAPVRRYEPEQDGWWDGYAFEIDPDFPHLAQSVAKHRRHLSSTPEEVP